MSGTAVLLGALAAQASATDVTVNIDDTDNPFDSISISTGGCSSISISNIGSLEEVNLTDCALQGGFGNITVSFAFLDLSSVVSDTFLETITPTGPNTALLNLDFKSCDGPASCGLVPPFGSGVPETNETLHVTVTGSGDGADTVDVTIKIAADVPTVPEPATLSLLGLGLAGVGFSRRARK